MSGGECPLTRKSFQESRNRYYEEDNGSSLTRRASLIRHCCAVIDSLCEFCDFFFFSSTSTWNLIRIDDRGYWMIIKLE